MSLYYKIFSGYLLLSFCSRTLMPFSDLALNWKQSLPNRWQFIVWVSFSFKQTTTTYVYVCTTTTYTTTILCAIYILQSQLFFSILWLSIQTFCSRYPLLALLSKTCLLDRRQSTTRDARQHSASSTASFPRNWSTMMMLVWWQWQLMTLLLCWTLRELNV